MITVRQFFCGRLWRSLSAERRTLVWNVWRARGRLWADYVACAALVVFAAVFAAMVLPSVPAVYSLLGGAIAMICFLWLFRYDHLKAKRADVVYHKQELSDHDDCTSYTETAAR